MCVAMVGRTCDIKASGGKGVHKAEEVFTRQKAFAFATLRLLRLLTGAGCLEAGQGAAQKEHIREAESRSCVKRGIGWQRDVVILLLPEELRRDQEGV